MLCRPVNATTAAVDSQGNNRQVMSRGQHVTPPSRLPTLSGLSFCSFWPILLGVLIMCMIPGIKPLLWSRSHIHSIQPKPLLMVTILHSIARITPPGTSCLAVQYSSATDKTIDIFSLEESGITPSRIEI